MRNVCRFALVRLYVCVLMGVCVCALKCVSVCVCGWWELRLFRGPEWHLSGS